MVLMVLLSHCSGTSTPSRGLGTLSAQGPVWPDYQGCPVPDGRPTTLAATVGSQQLMA